MKLLLWSRKMRGEREAVHKGTREVGNVGPDTEITFQFGVDEQDARGKRMIELANYTFLAQLVFCIEVLVWKTLLMTYN